LGGLFWFVPGFVEVDEVVPRFYRVWMGVTEFETAAFEGFEKKWFCFVVISLLFIEHGEVILGFQCARMIVA
jgi:hypothetical protein